MKVERAVVDTNVLISAALIADSAPARVTLFLLEHARLLFCAETFAEFETRIWRPKFDRYLSIESRKRLLHDFNAAAEWIELGPAPLPALCRDPDDDKFLHVALIGKADCLISGDQDLLDAAPMHTTRILSPAQAQSDILNR